MAYSRNKSIEDANGPDAVPRFCFCNVRNISCCVISGLAVLDIAPVCLVWWARVS